MFTFGWFVTPTFGQKADDCKIDRGYFKVTKLKNSKFVQSFIQLGEKIYVLEFDSCSIKKNNFLEIVGTAYHNEAKNGLMPSPISGVNIQVAKLSNKIYRLNHLKIKTDCMGKFCITTKLGKGNYILVFLDKDNAISYHVF